MKREGIMYLYKTQLGVKLIDKIANLCKKELSFLKYLVIVAGYLLMVTMLYLFGSSFWQYITNEKLFQAISAPPIAPLIPYFPKIFGMQSYFPDFYFIYFIISISIVAVVHEFSHGIFMRLFKIRIKSTGFAFLGPILGAFVEQDEKQMEKKPKTQQMAVLASGVFANLLIGIVFFIIMIAFFFAAYHPAGYIFNSYTAMKINNSDITSTNVIYTSQGKFIELKVGSDSYYLDENLSIQLSSEYQKNNLSYILAFGPAFFVDLQGAIIEINGNKIRDRADLQAFMATTKPGDEILITTKNESGDMKQKRMILNTNPSNPEIGYLGIGSRVLNTKTLSGKFFSWISNFKDSSTLYESNFNSGLAEFIYYLFWWIVLINILVALFNMLPLGILDGGRFFYLTILGITGSEKISKKSFKVVTWLLLAMLFFMLLWYFKRFL
jgi:membrane-associated protease RseP (regulator of RpoE activity)